jgi:hypothetical protein
VNGFRPLVENRFHLMNSGGEAKSPELDLDSKWNSTEAGPADSGESFFRASPVLVGDNGGEYAIRFN